MQRCIYVGVIVPIFEIFTKKNWTLLKAMVGTDFKLRYQQSFLGYVWSVLKPLMLFAIMYVVFIKFLRFGDSVPHFSVGLLLGTIMWNFFVEASGGGLGSVVGHGDLLRKVHFSKYIVTVSSVMSALINFGINLVVVVIFILVNGVEIRWSALWLIPIFAELILISTGVALFLGAWYVTLRDLSPIWEVVVQAGFYATPIIYPLSLVSTNVNPLIAKLMLLNPLAQIIQDARHVLISDQNPVIWGTFSHFWISFIPVIISIAIFVGGVMFFDKRSKNFAELV